MKTYRIHYRKPSTNPLSPGPVDVVEEIEAKSQKDAKCYGKRIAQEREWWFIQILR